MCVTSSSQPVSLSFAMMLNKVSEERYADGRIGKHAYLSNRFLRISRSSSDRSLLFFLCHFSIATAVW